MPWRDRVTRLIVSALGRGRPLAKRYWVVGVVVLAFLPAIANGYSAMTKAREQAMMEGFWVSVAAAECFPENGLATQVFQRSEVAAQMMLRQRWRLDGVRCSPGERAGDWPGPPSTWNEFWHQRYELGWGSCAETEEKHEALSYFGSKFSVVTHYLESACTSAVQSKRTLQWTIVGLIVAVSATVILARQGHQACIEPSGRN